ncbi:hypothetical protein [Streptomyces sp. F63]|uniref:hypothetical protein n=1 Tax=Streptomyces sp. F63 TaxID=2824887 RepID=UPI001FFD5B9B|nr:hypothetical protein [Streptomyces sp. F63]
MGLGIELCTRLQQFQDCYDQAVAEGDAARFTEVCAGKHGRWVRVCVLPDGHETSMEEPHWGRSSEGRLIAWVGQRTRRLVSSGAGLSPPPSSLFVSTLVLVLEISACTPG